MDWLADIAARTLEQTGRLTAVVQDNGPLHREWIGSTTVGTLARKRAIHFLFAQILLTDESD